MVVDLKVLLPYFSMFLVLLKFLYFLSNRCLFCFVGRKLPSYGPPTLCFFFIFLWIIWSICRKFVTCENRRSFFKFYLCTVLLLFFLGTAWNLLLRQVGHDNFDSAEYSTNCPKMKRKHQWIYCFSRIHVWFRYHLFDNEVAFSSLLLLCW